MDVRTGDRMSSCRGLMDPIAIWAKEGGEWAVIHRCRSCGMLRTNRVAGDDDEDALLAVALSSLEALPFPVAEASHRSTRASALGDSIEGAS